MLFVGCSLLRVVWCCCVVGVCLVLVVGVRCVLFVVWNVLVASVVRCVLLCVVCWSRFDVRCYMWVARCLRLRCSLCGACWLVFVVVRCCSVCGVVVGCSALSSVWCVLCVAVCCLVFWYISLCGVSIVMVVD